MSNTEVTVYEYFIEYSESHSTGYNDDAGDGTPYSGFIHSVTYTERLNLYKDRNNIKSYHVESIACTDDFPVGTEVFLVVVTYGDGGTFGREDGYWTVAGIYTDLKSAEAAKEVIKEHAKNKGSGGDWKSRFELPIEAKGNVAYVSCPWNGYFGGLESITIEPFTIKA